jgi:uncharacterized YccA/Bax inhibitor family protein
MNPVLNDKTFSNANFSTEVMTKSGVINKSIVLWVILAIGAYMGWTKPTTIAPLALPAILVAFVLAIIVAFKKNLAPFLSPIYAFLEGLCMGFITLFFEKDYPGIAVNAVFLTISVLFCMLAAFKAGFIKPTNKFYAIVGVSTLAICLLYIVDMVIMLFGGAGFPFITSSGPIGIIFSIFVVLIASLNLIIDFDFIQKGIAIGAPKYMEWYGAFALMVTIIWLYLEILRLLSKVRK